MSKRYLYLLFLLVVIFMAADLAFSYETADPGEDRYLIAVSIEDQEALDRFVETGLPAYARETGDQGDYLLAGASASQLSLLKEMGLTAAILDEVDGGSRYYTVYPLPDRPQPDLTQYGTVLLNDGEQILLRAATGDLDGLALSVLGLRKLTFEPLQLQREAPTKAPEPLVDPDPVIQSMIDQVISTTVYNYTAGLSGEVPVIVGGQPYTITTRHTYSGVPIQKATQFAGEHLANLGMAVEYHQWGGSTYPNVIGEITGQVNPDDIYIIGGHIDDMPSSGPAPGADDNASGSVAVMIAADIFSQFEWGCTLRFGFWTGEEQGLNGSYAYAQRSDTWGENILGYINLDMIAWNTDGTARTIDLHARENYAPGSLALAQLMDDVITAYNLDFDAVEVIANGSGASDHASFAYFGFPAFLGIEDFADFNIYYHTSNDKLQYLDLDYYTEFVRASVGTLAHASNCMLPDASGSLDGTVTDADGGAPIEGATVEMVRSDGWQGTVQTGASGYYTAPLNIGTYTVTASADWYLPVTVDSVVILTDTVTTVDFELVEWRADFFLPFVGKEE